MRWAVSFPDPCREAGSQSRGESPTEHATPRRSALNNAEYALAKKEDDVDPALKRWVTAHMPEKEQSPPEKADTSYTIYVSKSEAEKIAKIQRQFGCTRQEAMRQLMQAGLKQFGKLTGWWKDGDGE